MDKVTTKDMHEAELKRGDYVRIENQKSLDYGNEAIILDIRSEDVIALSIEGDDPCTVQLESSFLVQKIRGPGGNDG